MRRIKGKIGNRKSMSGYAASRGKKEIKRRTRESFIIGKKREWGIT